MNPQLPPLCVRLSADREDLAPGHHDVVFTQTESGLSTRFEGIPSGLLWTVHQNPELGLAVCEAFDALLTVACSENPEEHKEEIKARFDLLLSSITNTP